MAFLYGKERTRREILERVGNIEQIASAKKVSYQEGKEAGLKTIQVRTGGGLEFEILTDRGMDIGRMEYQGVPVSWVSPNGLVGPQYFEAGQNGWLRSFSGGMLTTCGLTTIGSPSYDPGNTLGDYQGLHGRISNTPAEHVSVDAYWEDDEYWMVIKGTVKETVVFGERVQLVREIRTRLGANRVELTDRIQNLHFKPVEHMLLYHCNIGYPLLSENTDIKLPALETIPREPELPLEGVNLFEAPCSDYPERVYYHEMEADHQGWTAVSVYQPDFNGRQLTFTLKYKKDELPRFVQWKLAEKGSYVMGLEPATNGVEGRKHAREHGELEYLQPLEQKEYHLIFEMGNQV